MRNLSTPHSNKKKGRNRQSKQVEPTTPVSLESSPVQESGKFAMVTPFKEEGTRPLRLSFSESIPLLSLDEYEAEEKNVPIVPVAVEKEKNNKLNASMVKEQKDDKAVLSSLPVAVSKELEGYEEQIGKAEPLPHSYIRFIERSNEELDGEVEYDLDEEDSAWMSIVNERRSASGLTPNLEPDTFELLMDRLEKESYFLQQNNGGIGAGAIVNAADEDAVCCICMDGECQNSNAILFCDMCNLAVHQDCYGVPYIPEGQWLCRRCLQSPSRAVDCALCPNRGGAFKQTDKPATWAHVVCALWIPEVRFANTVFLEPIDSIESIPAARWRLTCYLCKKRSVGACIQCHKSNCYAAFHVTCAQQAGLCMRMRTVQPASGEPMLVQKTAFCETHAPPDYQPSTNPADARRRAIANKKSSCAPVISIPTIPPERIREIANLAEGLPKKNQLIQRLIAYWTLKRQYRNGVPLLRRLQSSHLHPRAPASLDDGGSPPPDSELQDEMYKQLKYWQCLRQDLERARLLCELVRKREKLKKEYFKVKEKCMWFELKPLESILKVVLEALKAKDPQDIFDQPVDTEEVPDYLDIVTKPMDFSTMDAKIDRQEYDSFSAFEDDFNLMINNCLAYNRKDTMFYRAAIRLREQGAPVIDQVKKDYAELDSQEMEVDQEVPVVHVTPAKSRKRDRKNSMANRTESLENLNDSDVKGDVGKLNSSVTSVSNVSNGSPASGGVNRRTAVLFTRKARARANHGRSSPDHEQKKQSDSFKVYRSGGDADLDSDIGERDSQSSSCSSCSTSRSSSPDRENEDVSVKDAKVDEDKMDEIEKDEENKMDVDSNGILEILQLVWAKCRGYPWYPALIIDPNTPKGTIHKGVPIPHPPDDVLALADNYKDRVYLVLFFDTKRTWQWLPGEKLEPLGISKEIDESKLIESRKPTDRKAVKKAYQEALDYQKETVNSSIDPAENDDDNDD